MAVALSVVLHCGQNSLYRQIESVQTFPTSSTLSWKSDFAPGSCDFQIMGCLFSPEQFDFGFSDFFHLHSNLATGIFFSKYAQILNLKSKPMLQTQYIHDRYLPSYCFLHKDYQYFALKQKFLAISIQYFVQMVRQPE